MAKRRLRFSYLLLLLPFAALLWVPFYDRADPALFGIPFFYWYQLVWIVLGAVLILAVYLIESTRAP
ncbi:MAG TPA: DUF3311 domain-containing protein [Rhizomicrobium sp.]|jgi:hypothetical protein|nr:DUF3311 domain-containing protein [Rhizomicrobium sp.]